MIDVSLQPLPNQSLSIVLDGARYDITVKLSNGVMTASILRDGVTLVDGVRLVSGTPVLPYPYLESGNFILTTENYDLPYYDQFGNTQFLVYLTAAEVAAQREV